MDTSKPSPHPGVWVMGDSTSETLRHAQRVRELMGESIKALVDRSARHDESKTAAPEVAIFDQHTPRSGAPFGSDEYQRNLHEMGPALTHHYAASRHHPEHFENGVAGMTLVDLIEMLADWKAASEHGGDLGVSLGLLRERFAIGHQLACVLENTAREAGWL